MKIINYLLPLIALSTHQVFAANIFTITTFDDHSDGTAKNGTFNTPNFATPGDVTSGAETVTVVSGTTAGKINLELGTSNFGTASDPSINNNAFLEYKFGGTGSVEILVTELGGGGNGTNHEPYRFEFNTTGDVSDFQWRVQFESSLASNGHTAAFVYTVAQRTTIDPDGDDTVQNFSSSLSAFDPNLTQYDFSSFPNFQLDSRTNPEPDGTTTTILDESDPFVDFGSSLSFDGTTTNAAGRTVTDVARVLGNNSVGLAFKSLDSTDQLAHQFGAFAGGVESLNGSGFFDEGTKFALTFNGAYLANSQVVPEPSTLSAFLLGSLAFLVKRKRV